MRVRSRHAGRFGQFDLMQEFEGLGTGFFCRKAEVVLEGLRKLGTAGEDRVQRTQWVLEDHADLPAPNAAQLSFRQNGKIEALALAGLVPNMSALDGSARQMIGQP